MEFFVTAAGIPVHILDSKKGEKCLILLHGYLESMYIFTEFRELLLDHFRVITIDIPGHGLSGSAEVNSMEFDAQVVKEVLKKCGVEKAYIAGHSLGGYIALSCCNLYPEIFEKLVLLSSHPYIDPPEKAHDREREIAIIENGKLMTLAAASIPKMYNTANLRQLDEKIRETVELCEMHDPEGIIASIKGLQQRPDTQEFLLNTKMPVMIIEGGNDAFMPPAMIAEMQAKFTSVRHLLLPEAGHNAFLEVPEVVAKAVVEFLL